MRSATLGAVGRMRCLGALALAALSGMAGLVRAWPQGAGAEQRKDEASLERAWQLFEARDRAGYDAAFDELARGGDEVVRRLGEGIAQASVPTRRARAELLAELASPGGLELGLRFADDADSQVRFHAARFLGSVELGTTVIAERVERLAALAREDPDEDVRAGAVEGLGAVGGPEAVRALDRLFRALDPSGRLDVIRALQATPDGRRRTVALTQEAFLGSDAAQAGSAEAAERLDAPGLAELLRGYGRALAELPRGGVVARDRAPLVRGLRHPARGVRRAARLGINRLYVRLVESRELERADQLLADLAADGVEPHDMIYRRVFLALAESGDAARALELASALGRAAEEAPLQERLTWRFYALHLGAAAHFAARDFEAALEGFRRASALQDLQIRERLDLVGDEARRLRGAKTLGAELMVDRLELAALEEMWQGVTLLARDRDVADPAMLEHLRRCHQILLQTRAVDLKSGSERGGGSFDGLLQRDLGPGPLVLSNERLDAWKDGEGLDLLLELGRALATVSPSEALGFEPAPEKAQVPRELSDPLFDPERRAALEALRTAQETRLQLEFQKTRRAFREDPAQRRNRERLLQMRVRDLQEKRRRDAERLRRAGDLADVSSEALRGLLSELAAFFVPSRFALDLAESLRAVGRTEEGRALGRRYLADLGGGLAGGNEVGAAWLGAEAEILIGSTFMDERRPQDAEDAFLASVRRLEALENQIESVRAQDPGWAESALAATRTRRSNAYLSLAVNANVRMGDTERALAYFEQAFELDQRDFMQVLLACYRARSGRVAEARAVVANLRATPPLYYNLACTHALLGDTDLALDYLSREFTENHDAPGSLRRQKDWASEDPDLASLRDDPRFQALVR